MWAQENEDALIYFSILSAFFLSHSSFQGVCSASGLKPNFSATE